MDSTRPLDHPAPRRADAAPGKHPLRSRTVWLNLIATAVALAAAFGVDVGLDGEQQLALATAAVTLVNLVLRGVTREPLRPIARRGGGALVPVLLVCVVALTVAGCESIDALRGRTLEHAEDVADAALAEAEAALCSRRFSMRAYRKRFGTRWEALATLCGWEPGPIPRGAGGVDPGG